MTEESGSLKSPPDGMVRARVVVARDQLHLWQSLREQFVPSADIEVVLDRRLGERRQWEQGHASDRRGRDRRRPISTEYDVQTRQYVIVRAQRSEGPQSARRPPCSRPVGREDP